MLEAIEQCQQIAGRELSWTLSDRHRVGDHRWWISDIEPFRRDYPGWRVTRTVTEILQEIHDRNVERWLSAG
jgi:CDP-paratose 2-epimerase